MWLICSSIGKKLIMSITGICLILFLTFHMLMNLVVIFSPEAYNMVCAMLGANWYALIATKGLAALALIHIVYAFVLYFNNKKARGNDAYAVTSRPKEVEWASQNMLALGIVVAAFLVLHMFHFWAKMQLVEVQHMLGMVGDNDPAFLNATNGAYHIANTFSNPVIVILYLVALGALWFHLTHGFWSALHTMGINNEKWFSRWRCIGNIYVTILILGFALVVVTFFIKSFTCGVACPL